MIGKRNSISKAVIAAALVGFAMPTVAVMTPAIAQDDDGESSGRKVSQTISPGVGRDLTAVYELMTAEQYAQAKTAIDAMIAKRGQGMKPYDRATTYQIRGSINFNLGNLPAALRDFETAIAQNAFDKKIQDQLRYAVAQIHFQLGNFQTAIRGLESWIRGSQAAGEAVDPNAYYLLAAAHVSVEPPNYGRAERPAEQAIAGTTEPSKSQHDLLNLIYSELNRSTKRTRLLEKMINFWPDSKSYWLQLSGAYSQSGKDVDAFTVVEVAYRAGLLDKEGELLTLVNYYSFHNNPYRGAKMLEDEMNAGNIKRNRKNLELLSQLWTQAREHKRAIPVLRDAAGRSDTGELYFRLGQVLFADEQYTRAEAAIRQALNKGKLSERLQGEAYLLLGNAIFAQADADDVPVWERAKKAFESAKRYRNVAGQANSWVNYVQAVIDTYKDGLEVERLLDLKRCQGDLERLRRQKRIDELQGRVATPETVAQEEELAARCAELALTPAQREAAAAEAAPAAGDDDAAPTEEDTAAEDAAPAEPAAAQ